MKKIRFKTPEVWQKETIVLIKVYLLRRKPKIPSIDPASDPTSTIPVSNLQRHFDSVYTRQKDENKKSSLLNLHFVRDSMLVSVDFLNFLSFWLAEFSKPGLQGREELRYLLRISVPVKWIFGHPGNP